jgi:hypothetical protein
MFIDISMTEGSSLRPSHITVPDFAIRLYHTLFSVNDVRNAPEICFIFSFVAFLRVLVHCFIARVKISDLCLFSSIAGMRISCGLGKV